MNQFLRSKISTDFFKKNIFYMTISLVSVLYILSLFELKSNYSLLINNFTTITFNQLLPFYFYFLPILILIGTILNGETKRKYFIISLTLFALIWLGTGAIIDDYPRNYDSFFHFSLVKAALDGNVFLILNNYPTPLLYFITTPILYLLNIFSVSDILFLRLYPIIYGIVITLLIFLLLERMLGNYMSSSENTEKIAFIGTYVFVIGNNSLETHFSPQSLGFFLLLVNLYLIVSFLENIKSKKNISYLKILSLILLYLIIFVSHLITAMILTFFYGFLFLIYGIPYMNKKNLLLLFSHINDFFNGKNQLNGEKTKFSHKHTIFFAMIVIFALIFLPVIIFVFNYIFTESIKRILLLLVAFFQNPLDFIQINPNYIIPAIRVSFNTFFFRLLVHLGLFAFFLLSLIALRKNTSLRSSNKRIFLALFLSDLGYLMITVIFLNGYLYDRTFIYGYIFIAIGHVFLLKSNFLDKFDLKTFPKIVKNIKAVYIYLLVIILLTPLAMASYFNFNGNSTLITDQEFEGIQQIVKTNGIGPYLTYLSNSLISYFNYKAKTFYDGYSWQNMDWSYLTNKTNNVNLLTYFNSSFLIVIFSKQMYFNNYFSNDRLGNVSYTLNVLNASKIYSNSFITAWKVNLSLFKQ